MRGYIQKCNNIQDLGGFVGFIREVSGKKEAETVNVCNLFSVLLPYDSLLKLNDVNVVCVHTAHKTGYLIGKDGTSVYICVVNMELNSCDVT